MVRVKCRATGFDASVSFVSTSRSCSRKRSANFLPVLPMLMFLRSVQVMQWMTFTEMHVKWSVILADQ